MSAINVDDFHDTMGNHDKAYNLSIYEFSLDIERMKLVHAFALLSFSVFIMFKAAKERGILLKEKHIAQLIFVSWVLFYMYLLSVMYFLYATYSNKDFDHHKNYVSNDWFVKSMSRFSLFMTTMLERTDMGPVGLTISCLIHVQMIGLLCLLTCLAFKSKHIIERKDKHK